MNLFNSHNRPELVKRLNEQHYDLLVIGGGVTGAGIALDAVSRGLKVALLEKNDFASGTSSKSTKLIHGGLRYLKQFEIALVREVGKERAVVHRLAPHLVKSEKMLLPLIKDGTYGKILTSFGLMIYDVLAGVEKADQRVMLSKDETIEKEPLLDKRRIEGGGIYAEYRTDDARLTIEILKTAVQHGADAINYAEITDFSYNDKGEISGAFWTDNLSGDKYAMESQFVISAAGPWVDEIRKKNKSLNAKRLHLTKGVHVVLPHVKFPVNQSVYFDVPDGRMIFAIPRGRVTYVGTTDTDFSGDINNVQTHKEDVKYLIDGVKDIFPNINLSIDDVESSWAGLRPLIEEEGKSASELSRKDEIFESESGLLSIAGGKLTGYRKMAERIVDKLVEKMEGSGFGSCKTDKISLTGGPFENSQQVDDYQQKISNGGFTLLESEYLVSNYGRQSDVILSIFEQLDFENKEVRLAIAELKYTIENESTHTCVDFFERRTGRLYFDINSIERLKEPVLTYMAENLNWSENRMNQERKWLKSELDKAVSFK